MHNAWISLDEVVMYWIDREILHPRFDFRLRHAETFQLEPIKTIVNALYPESKDHKKIRFCMHTCLTEALMNANKHGTEDNEEYGLAAYSFEGGVICRVTQVKDIPKERYAVADDCKTDELLETPNGRGRLMMQTYATSLFIRGHELFLYFKNI